MSNDIIAPQAEPENPFAKQDAILSAAAEEYRQMVAAGFDPRMAALIIDVSLGIADPPAPDPEYWT